MWLSYHLKHEGVPFWSDVFFGKKVGSLWRLKHQVQEGQSPFHTYKTYTPLSILSSTQNTKSAHSPDLIILTQVFNIFSSSQMLRAYQQLLFSGSNDRPCQTVQNGQVLLLLSFKWRQMEQDIWVVQRASLASRTQRRPWCNTEIPYFCKSCNKTYWVSSIFQVLVSH